MFDPSLAPPGKHVVHIYAAANEPAAPWTQRYAGGADTPAFGARPAEGYEAAKAAAAEPLWRALEAIIPDIRARAEVELVGSPLTHARFTRRHRGTYGPAGLAARGDLRFRGSGTPLPGLLLCGDSTFPGIGVPAVAASGIIAANSLAPLGAHLELLREARARGVLAVGREWWTRPGDGPATIATRGGRIAVDLAPEETIGGVGSH